MDSFLTETLTPKQSHLLIESSPDLDNNGKPKTYYMKGLFIQGDVRNHNGRIYPSHEIRRAVNQINQRLDSGETILGEIDHPETLNINLDRVSHMITEMKLEGADGYGTMKIIETVQSGQIIKGLLDVGVRLGVSSRGSGDVGPGGYVSNFEIITVDIVANPSAPNAFPDIIREARRQKGINSLSYDSINDDRAKLYLQKELKKFIGGL